MPASNGFAGMTFAAKSFFHRPEAIMRFFAGLVVSLALSGCTYNNYYPVPAAGEAAIPPGAECHEFTQSVTIGGKAAQATGQVCRQPDGTWRIM